MCFVFAVTSPSSATTSASSSRSALHHHQHHQHHHQVTVTVTVTIIITIIITKAITLTITITMTIIGIFIIRRIMITTNIITSRSSSSSRVFNIVAILNNLLDLVQFSTVFIAGSIRFSVRVSVCDYSCSSRRRLGHHRHYHFQTTIAAKALIPSSRQQHQMQQPDFGSRVKP